MRPLEVLVVLAAAGALLAAVLPLPRPLRRPAVPAAALGAAVLALLAHLLVEGPRRPMIAGYALVGLLVLARLVRATGPAAARRPAERVVAGALGVLVLAAAAALPVLVPVHTFPHPSGPYAVGTTTHHWVDTARPDVLSADPTVPRELVVQIWYPAQDVPSAPRAPYLPDVDAVGSAMSRAHGIPRLVFDAMAEARGNAVADAPVAPDRARYPVLIFLEGLTGYRQMNTFQVEELVSHGYVVAGIDQPSVASAVVLPGGRLAPTAPAPEVDALLGPDLGHPGPAPTLHGRAFPDGVVGFLARDVTFTLDRLADLDRADPGGLLTGRLDLDRNGLFGISMGGIVGGEACRVDPRLRACLLMDAPMPTEVVRDGLPQPTMWITRDAASMVDEGWAAADVEEHQTTMRDAFGSARAPSYLVRVPGMFHADFTDIPDLAPVVSLMGLAGPIDGRLAHDVVNGYSTAFFDRHLGGLAAPLLDEPADRHPGVLVDSRRP